MEQSDQRGQPHQRRVRYKGTHPRKYSEKYKELNQKNIRIPLRG